MRVSKERVWVETMSVVTQKYDCQGKWRTVRPTEPQCKSLVRCDHLKLEEHVSGDDANVNCS